MIPNFFWNYRIHILTNTLPQNFLNLPLKLIICNLPWPFSEVIVHAVNILDIHNFVGTNLYVSASMENSRSIDPKFDCSESVECFFACFNSFYGWFIETVNFDIDVVVVRNI